jgi:hypothetical protein
MRERSSSEIRELIADIDAELDRLARLDIDMRRVVEEIERDPLHAPMYYESLALKLHNFYTGCERIFQLIASEINGGVPSSFDWHRRLLERMASEREGRIAVLSADTAAQLGEFLAFRHIVRNLYGFELDPARVGALAARQPAAWRRVESEIRQFAAWLRELAARLSH